MCGYFGGQESRPCIFKEKAMDERNLLRIARHLKDEAAQQRVRQNIQRGHNEVTVTIGRAARLFGFSESQLRDWEKMGLIKPLRPRERTETKDTTGQRQYSFSELDKLAIIRELLDEARVTPGSIPANIDEIWNELAPSYTNGQAVDELVDLASEQQDEHINKRITTAYRDMLSWRFYASRALWLSLLLIYENVSGSYAGLVLPAYESSYESFFEVSAATMQDIGEALVGWLGQTRSFFTFLSSGPSFEYPSDYSVQPLFPPELQARLPASPAHRTLLVIQREEAQHVRYSEKAITTVQRLLEPLYEDRQNWHHYLGEGMRDIVDPNMNFTPKLIDAVLTWLTNIVIRLGGKKLDGQERWKDCCLLLPNDIRLPLQQRSLVVRAKSRQARYTIGVTTFKPERYGASLCLRAYQSSNIIYRRELSREDTIPYSEMEGSVGSSIAVPVGAETGLPLGVLYVTSYDTDAFSVEDQRVLRVLVKIVEELLHTYKLRQQLTEKLTDILEDPGSVDPFFKTFPSENDFLFDVETLLTEIRANVEHREPSSSDSRDFIKEISFIALDLDNNVQETVANSFGEQTLHNLNKALGLRIRDLLPALFSNHLHCKLYHIYSGVYYLLLRGFSLEKTKNNAERLRKALEGSIAVKQSDLPGGTLLLPEISVHLGVTWYSYEKLADFFDPSYKRSIVDVRSTLYHSLDFVLKMGADTKGNIVYTWDSATSTYVPLQSREE
jgi:DNA-binding transcriptional MerR regulator